MSEEKKIIVDEDWKSQVAKEKEAARHAGTPGEPSDEAPSAVGGPSEGSAELPPASFEILVTMLATEAMAGLGQLPHPMSGKFEANPAAARYAIDMLEMLAEKTKGNLTPSEEQGLRELLHQLRMAFVALQSPQGRPAPATND